MKNEAEKTVLEYFARMRAGDKSVLDLFHDDAVLNGLGARQSGKDAIREFYLSVMERAGPSPRSAGPLLSEGSRVAAEILIDLSDERVIHAVDLFVVEEGRIKSLTYFICTEAE